MSERAEARLAELRQMSEEFAKAYAERNYLEEFRKSKLAMLISGPRSRGTRQRRRKTERQGPTRSTSSCFRV